MSLSSTLSSFLPTLELTGLVACLLIIPIMLFWRGYEREGNGLLLVSFLTILYPLFIVHLYSTNTIQHYPHLLRTSGPISLLYMPAMYLYVQTVVGRRSLRWSDAFHLAPALLFFVDFLPFYALPADAKQRIILGNHYWSQLTRFDEGWLMPAYWHHYIRSGQFAIYWLVEVLLLYRLARAQRADLLVKSRVWFDWMSTIVGLQAILFIPAAGITLFDWESNTLKFWYDLALTLIALLTCITLLFRPEILYGLQHNRKPVSDGYTPALQPDNENITTDKLEHYIPQSLVLVYDRRIQEFMHTQEAFLRPGYTIREMAENTGIPLHHLSAVINRHYGYHFNEYINHRRIEYLKQRLDKREWKNKTLEALAQESGFTNRTSFITAFKKHCGTTPSDYIRNMKNAV